MICRNCGNLVKETDKFCKSCGRKLIDPGICHRCGASVRIGDRFCRKCGQNFVSNSDTKRTYPDFINVELERQLEEMLSSIPNDLLMDIDKAMSISAILHQTPSPERLIDKIFSKRFRRDIVTLIVVIPAVAGIINEDNMVDEKTLFSFTTNIMKKFVKRQWVKEYVEQADAEKISILLDQFFSKPNMLAEYQFVINHPEMVTLSVDMAIASMALKAYLLEDSSAEEQFMDIRERLSTIQQE